MLGKLHLLCAGFLFFQASLAFPQAGLDTSVEESSEDDGAQNKTAAKTTSCPCGFSNKARVVGGEEALKNEFPLMAGLLEMNAKRIFCGATIITLNHALTAAHCTAHTRNMRLGLFVGGHNITAEKRGRKAIIPVSKTITHEKFEKDTFHFDIALVVLSKSITTSETIGRACLPPGRINVVNQTAKVLGWGRVERNKTETSDVLMKLNVKIIPIEKCKENYTREIPIDEPFQLCTYRRKKDSCQGDSGGPLIWLDPETNRFTLVGIISYGKKCGYHAPAVNSEVGYFLDWIMTKISGSGVEGEICHKI